MPNANERTDARRSRVPELLGFICDVLTDRLRRRGIGENETNEISLDITDSLCKEFGGQMIYFPKGKLIDADEKAEETYKAFMGGKNIPDLAREFNCSMAWIYTRISRVRAKRKAERKPTTQEKKT